MKKVITTISLLVAFCFTLLSQIHEPVKWTFDKKELSGTSAELIFKANIEHKWHLYGMEIPAGGPIATNIVFEKIVGAELVDGITASHKAKEKHDAYFGMTLPYFQNNVNFKQKINVTDKNFTITGYIEYMACNDETCLKEQEPFQFGNVQNTSQASTSQGVVVPIAVGGITPVTIPTHTHHNASAVEQSESPTATDGTPIAEAKTNFWEPITQLLHGDDAPDNTSKKSVLWWIIFIKGFLGGLIAIFTPCVWPIIPMTVSFFLKRNEGWKKGKTDAMLYGASIIVIYLLLGIIITLVFGANALNSLSTSVIFNLLFFTLLIVFGASLIGAFELTLPASWSTKLDAKAENTTGIWSIFLMAFTLVLVSFSCTAPIIGTLLVDVSVSGSILAPAIGMFGFALALAIPFTLFALFPAMMKAMPKSGSWLNAVKVVLGFLILALSLKYLTVADLGCSWGIISREVFLALWIVIFFLLGLYLLGKIRFAHDSEVKSLSFGRLILSILPFAFALYMLPGLWGAPLKAISSFAPPLYTQDFNLINNQTAVEFHNFDEGMIFAQQANKPVLVDFTGYSCSNCKKMEASVLTKPEVRQLIAENFVLISLFVDDKTALEEPFKVIENNKTYTIKTLGDKWSYLQRYKFGANAQPYFVILDNEAKPLTKPFYFSENTQEFLNFLNDGLKNFQEK